MAVWYLDTSAIAKLILDEPHSAALRSWVAERAGGLASSAITGVELARTIRSRMPGAESAVEDVLDAIDLIAVDASVLGAAAEVDPRELRSLDAIHLSSAMSLAEDLHGIVTYDHRQADAARMNGVEVVAPI